MKGAVIPLLLAGHGLTQLGISQHEMWRPWLQAHSPGSLGAATVALFALRLAADLALCAWVARGTTVGSLGGRATAWLRRGSNGQGLESQRG
jgi:hypothetical protein